MRTFSTAREYSEGLYSMREGPCLSLSCFAMVPMGTGVKQIQHCSQRPDALYSRFILYHAKGTISFVS